MTKLIFKSIGFSKEKRYIRVLLLPANESSRDDKQNQIQTYCYERLRAAYCAWHHAEIYLPFARITRISMLNLNFLAFIVSKI